VVRPRAFSCVSFMTSTIAATVAFLQPSALANELDRPVAIGVVTM